MKISDKFAEYGLTGGFFWLIQILFLIYSTDQNLTEFLKSLFGAVTQFSIPNVLSAAIGSFLAVIGIISIFFTGLLLDLIGSYFIFLEVGQFKKQIHLNEEWLDDLVKNKGEYIKKDYEAVKKTFRVPNKKDYKRHFQDIIFPFRIFTIEFWKDSIEDIKTTYQNIKLIRSYTTILEFIQSFVLIHSNFNILIYEIHLWRTSRAISTALLIGAFEFYSAFFIKEEALYSHLFYFLIISLSLFITYRSYHRMIFRLFSLAYVVGKKID